MSSAPTIRTPTDRQRWPPSVGGMSVGAAKFRVPPQSGVGDDERTAADRNAGPRIGGVVQGESAAPGAASAGRAGVRLSFAGRSGAASRQSRSRNELRYSPLTRIPLPSHAAAAACPRGTPVPPAIRRASLRALPATGHDIGSLLRPARDLAPRPVALCTPNGIVGPARYPRAAAQWPSRKRPPSRATATWRSVPLRRVDRSAARLRRGTSGTFRCRHKRPTSVRRRP